MSNLGIGVMIHMLSGTDPVAIEALKNANGKVITDARIDDNKLKIQFTDGTGIVFWDNGQSCCESRYMTIDGDNLDQFKGDIFLDAVLKDAPNLPGSEEHEVQFLQINTNKGAITVTNHNEHNGYYGGFALTVGVL